MRVRLLAPRGSPALSNLTRDEDLARRLGAVPSCTAIDIIMRRYPVDQLIVRGVKPIQHADAIVAGPARTLRFLPARFDHIESPTRQVNFELIDSVRPGEVLVFDAMRGTGGSVLGDMLALRAVTCGAAGVVTDGAVRDLSGLHPTGLPVFAGHIWPIPFRGTLLPWEADVTIQCGGALVEPGDFILADRDAVLVMPCTIVDYVLEHSEEFAYEETFSRKLVEQGHTLSDVFPIRGGLRDLYERFRGDGRLPSAEEVAVAADRQRANCSTRAKLPPA
jgi:5-oxopent-3-ene-1,2,5-tricarboxylate decarboxylase / 2-hydroxyhepta-2,4-diene-1,7-dioate isomerase